MISEVKQGRSRFVFGWATNHHQSHSFSQCQGFIPNSMGQMSTLGLTGQCQGVCATKLPWPHPISLPFLALPGCPPSLVFQDHSSPSLFFPDMHLTTIGRVGCGLSPSGKSGTISLSLKPLECSPLKNTPLASWQVTQCQASGLTMQYAGRGT